MSTLALTFQVQALDFSPLDRGQVDVVFNDGSQNYTLTLRLRVGSSTYGYFEEVAWISGSLGENEAQAANYRNSWNRDYAFVGGTTVNGFTTKNLSATLVGNVVTITAINGTFTSWNYTGNVIIVGGSIDNSVQATPDNLIATRTASTGDCSTIQYVASATGDNLPFDLYDGTTLLQAAWDGTATNLNLSRGIPHTLRILNGALERDSVVVNVPRVLSGSEFSISLTQYLTSSDVVVTGPTVGGLTPYNYAITPVGDSTGSNYQTSNTFQGVLEGQYRLWIRDVYGCETSRVIDVTVAGGSEPEPERWFLIPEGQSIPFAENVQFDKDNKPNFFNTGSYNENVLTVYRTGQEFDAADDNVGIQFQSSYPFHLVQLVGSDNSIQTLSPIEIQTNLGVIEKVDCVLYPLPGQETTKTGVYFNGGNKYEPNTTTAIEGSPYDGTTPKWAKVGQLVTFDGLGTFTITGTGFDTTRGGYFVVDLVTASEGPGFVQVVYNKHPYNLFEVYFSPSQLTGFSYIVIDKGFDGVEWDGNAFVSEPIIKINDTIDHLLVEWSDSKNRGDIVFSSLIKYWFRRVGEFYGDFSNNESEIYPGDAQTYSIKQKTFLDFTVTFEMLTARQVNMLNIASALENFSVNGLKLVRKEAPEITRFGKSNLHTWKCQFAFGANQVAVQGDEIVLSVNNNTITGEGPDLSAITLYKNNAGKLVLNNSATLVKQ